MGTCLSQTVCVCVYAWSCVRLCVRVCVAVRVVRAVPIFQNDSPMCLCGTLCSYYTATPHFLAAPVREALGYMFNFAKELLGTIYIDFLKSIKATNGARPLRASSQTPNHKVAQVRVFKGIALNGFDYCNSASRCV